MNGPAGSMGVAGAFGNMGAPGNPGYNHAAPFMPMPHLGLHTPADLTGTHGNTGMMGATGIPGPAAYRSPKMRMIEAIKEDNVVELAALNDQHSRALLFEDYDHLLTLAYYKSGLRCLKYLIGKGLSFPDTFAWSHLVKYWTSGQLKEALYPKNNACVFYVDCMMLLDGHFEPKKGRELPALYRLALRPEIHDDLLRYVACLLFGGRQEKSLSSAEVNKHLTLLKVKLEFEATIARTLCPPAKKDCLVY